jgi:hypothetical protein
VLTLTSKGKKIIAAHEEHEKALLDQIAPHLNVLRPEDVARFSSIVNSITDFIKN